MVSFRGQIKLESCPVCSPLSASLTLTSDGTSRVSSYFTLETASTFLCRMKTKHRISTRKFITSDRALPIKALDRSRLTVILNTILLDVNTLLYKRFFFVPLKVRHFLYMPWRFYETRTVTCTHYYYLQVVPMGHIRKFLLKSLFEPCSVYELISDS